MITITEQEILPPIFDRTITKKELAIVLTEIELKPLLLEKEKLKKELIEISVTPEALDKFEKDITDLIKEDFYKTNEELIKVLCKTADLTEIIPEIKIYSHRSILVLPPGEKEPRSWKLPVKFKAELLLAKSQKVNACFSIHVTPTGKAFDLIKWWEDLALKQRSIINKIYLFDEEIKKIRKEIPNKEIQITQKILESTEEGKMLLDIIKDL